MPIPKTALSNLKPALDLIAAGTIDTPEQRFLVVAETGDVSRAVFGRKLADATLATVHKLWGVDRVTADAEGRPRLLVASVKVDGQGVSVLPSKTHGDVHSAADVKGTLKRLKARLIDQGLQHPGLTVLLDAPLGGADPAAPPTPRAPAPGGAESVTAVVAQRLRAEWRTLSKDAEPVIAAAEALAGGTTLDADTRAALGKRLRETVAQADMLEAKVAALAVTLTPGHPDLAVWKPRLAELSAGVSGLRDRVVALKTTIGSRLLPDNPGPSRPRAATPAVDTMGVPAWFLDPKARLERMIKSGEELFALAHIAMSAADVLGDDEAKRIADELRAKGAGVGTLFHSPAVEAEKSGSPVIAKKLKDLHDAWTQAEADREAVADRLRKAWQDGHRKTLTQEVIQHKTGASARWVNAYGDGQLLEHSKVAEVMAANWTGVPGGFSPYKVTDATKHLIEKPLAMAEVAAIFGYTTQDYAAINGVLRARATRARAGKAAVAPTPERAAEEARYDLYIETCVSALKKLKAHKGTVMRSDRDLHSSIVDELIQHGRRTEPGLLSAGFKKVPSFGHIVSVISGIKTGKNVTMFSLHSTEGEVLFPPGSVFRFDKAVLPGQLPITDHKKLAGVIDTTTTHAELHFTQVK